MAMGDVESRPAEHQPPIDLYNPLASISAAELDEIVASLCRGTETCERADALAPVVTEETLLTGAQMVKDPGPDQFWKHKLTGPENRAIDDENKEKTVHWFLPPEGLHAIILTTAFAAITQGWQQSTINASSLFRWQHELGLSKDSQYLEGALNAAPWLLGSIIGTWLSDPLQDKFFGRRPALCVSSVFCIACVIGSAHCNSWETLMVCRILLGVGIGSKASIAPVFAAEAAPDGCRGRVLMMWQLFDALGIFLGFVSAFLVQDNWRVLLATAIIPAIGLLAMVYACPESPRFLIRKNRYPEAFQSLRRLRRTDLQAARDIFSIHVQLQHETKTRWTRSERNWLQSRIYQDWTGENHFYKRIWILFKRSDVRRACLVAYVVMASQQLCGINVLAFYSSDLFITESKDLDNNKIRWFNFGFGLAMFLFTIVAYRFIDDRGRRKLLLISLGGMTLSLILVSGLFYIPNPTLRAGLVPPFSIVVYTFFYSIGAGPIPFTMSAEIFPLCVREVGMSFSVMVNFFGLGLLVLFVPRLTQAFAHGQTCGKNAGSETQCHGQANLLFFFSGLNVLAFILVYLLVPETSKLELENVYQLFEKIPKKPDDELEEELDPRFG